MFEIHFSREYLQKKNKKEKKNEQVLIFNFKNLKIKTL